MNSIDNKTQYLNNIKILIVDDDSDELELLEDIIKMKYPNTITAINGQDGLEKYKEFLPDIVITDINMPIMDGLKMSKLIKQENNDAKIIILSAFESSTYLKKAINLDISRYITKPIDNDILFKGIEDVATNLYTQEELIFLNQKYKEQKDIAQNANKSKSEFLANMSHEIRTPLNAILGFIELIRDGTKEDKTLEYANIIDESSNGLLHIIEDILDFSKIESGKIDIHKLDFNTKQELETISYLFDAKCSQKDINLSVVFDGNIPKAINTDPLRLKQIIANLISNSIKFTQAHKNIFINFKYENKHLKVSVKDEGKGIAQDKLEHIFDAFSQEDSSTTREFGGTGLGLSISSELTRLLGGELKVKSELGSGSEFYFDIPITVANEIVKVTNNADDLDFTDKKILLVEDNKANQLFMKVILKKMKLDFDIANDGVEAVESFNTSKYDCILMDENMPNMGGIEATKKY